MKEPFTSGAVAAAATVFAMSAHCAQIGYDTLIAHRGESIDAPENTLPAYKMAVERGFGFECDVYLSKDGRVFTFHDRNLKRTTDGANTNRCADVTWDEISRLDVGGWGVGVMPGQPRGWVAGSHPVTLPPFPHLRNGGAGGLPTW